MLVIKRKREEGVIIGDDIEIKIIDIGENSVKIAIDAPKEYRIFRKELLDEVKVENSKAAELDLDILRGLK